MLVTKTRGMVIKLRFPNILSLCWIIICLKIIVTRETATRTIFDYCLYGLVVAYMIIGALTKVTINRFGKMIWKYFLCLFVISVIGILRNVTALALTSVIGVYCVMSLVISCGLFCSEIQGLYIRPMFYFVLFRLLLLTIRGDYLGNTTPGVLCFLTYGFIICVMNKRESTIRKKHLFRYIDYFTILVAFVLMIYINWKSDARTAVLTAVGIIIVYMLFSISKLSELIIKKIFWIGCMFAIVLTIAYINIHTFQWYETVNAYSLSSFGKNLDSSRPELWSYSLDSLTWFEVIIGQGTGILPQYRGYQSFHNSFIQLIMQNGIIGLLPLMFVFKEFWYNFSVYFKDKICRMILSCIVGIIAYNLFETTLFQNKVFLGMCQWILVCMGIIRGRYLDKQNTISDYR